MRGGARSAVLVVAALALGACARSGIDAAAKADLDRRLSQLAVSEETYPPSEGFIPMAFVVGQWTQHRIIDENGEPALLTFKLVGQDSGGYWVEMLTESYHGREAVKMFVVLNSGRDPAGMEIRFLKLKVGDGAPIELEGAALDRARDAYHDDLDLLASVFEPADRDDFHVPAGHFVGCYAAQTKEPWGPWDVPSVICSHPSVPLSGVVHAQPVGKVGVMELVAFGLTGARGEL
jgi:hypothetical protein